MPRNKSRVDHTQTVSAEWLNQNIHNDKLIILDATIKKVSDSSSFSSEEWIPNTRYFDLKGKFSDTNAEFPTTLPSAEQFEREARILGINQDSNIIVYDTKGIYSSARVWWLFKTFGFENVAVLDGGLPEWKRLNYKTVATLEVLNWNVGDFTSDYQPDNMCFLKHIAEISTNKTCLILDARSEKRFKGIVPEPREGLRSGTIPNSENLPYTNLLNGHCLKTKEELKIIFDSYTIGDKKMIFSCGSGITACILALAADISGHKKLTVYDGSWTEYGTLTK